MYEVIKYQNICATLLDKSQKTQEYSSATFVFNAGIPTKIDDTHTITHNKVMVIDRETDKGFNR